MASDFRGYFFVALALFSPLLNPLLGKVISKTETWSYDTGHIHCIMGNYKNHSFTWQQNTFSCPTSTDMGYGIFDPSTDQIDYFFPHCSRFGDPFSSSLLFSFLSSFSLLFSLLLSPQPFHRPVDHEKFFSLDISHTSEEAIFSCNHMLWFDKLTWVYHKQNKYIFLLTNFPCLFF